MTATLHHEDPPRLWVTLSRYVLRCTALGALIMLPVMLQISLQTSGIKAIWHVWQPPSEYSTCAVRSVHMLWKG